MQYMCMASNILWWDNEHIFTGELLEERCSGYGAPCVLTVVQ